MQLAHISFHPNHRIDLAGYVRERLKLFPWTLGLPVDVIWLFPFLLVLSGLQAWQIMPIIKSMEEHVNPIVFNAHLKKHFLFYLLLACLILVNIPIFIGLLSDWLHDGNYSHGFLVIPISIFLIYRRRNDLTFPAKTSRAGLVIFIVGCLGLIFGTAASEFFTARFSLVLSITGLALYYLGTVNFRKIWFAFFFLLFMLPLPATIYYAATMPMQLFATKITNQILQFIGVPSHRAGNIIYLPAFRLEVNEACSGLRSLATMLALGALLGNLTLPGRIRPIILFLAAIPIAIVVNIVRLVFTGVGAYAISPKLAESFLHELSGILVFILAIILMTLIAGLLRWKRNRS